MIIDLAAVARKIRRDPRVAATYVGCFSFIAVVYCVLHSYGIEFYDHYLTMAAALQTAAFALLGMKIRASDLQGISTNMIYSYIIAYVARLSTTFTLQGYLPEDQTSEVYLYQLSELVGLIVLCYNLRSIWSMKRRSSAELIQVESTVVVPAFVVLCIGFAMLTKSNAHQHYVGDVLWMFSQWMESVAMVPQLWLVSREKTVERRTSHFMALMIVARVVLSVFWISVIDEFTLDVWFKGGMMASNAIHLLLCADYMYYFVKTARKPMMLLPSDSSLSW